MKVYTICSGFCTLLSVSEAKKHGATYIIKLWKTRCVLEKQVSANILILFCSVVHVAYKHLM